LAQSRPHRRALRPRRHPLCRRGGRTGHRPGYLPQTAASLYGGAARLRPRPHRRGPPRAADDPGRCAKPAASAARLRLCAALPEGLRPLPRRKASGPRRRRHAVGALPPGFGMSALLEVEHLHVRFRQMGPIKARLVGGGSRFLDAVLDVSFSVAAGTTFALVGESGSGKSTLGRAVTGLVPMHHGSVRFDGQEPLKQGNAALAAYRRQVAMMFQDPVASLSPRLTVKSLITEPFVIHGMRDRQRDGEARRLLTLVGLPPDF